MQTMKVHTFKTLFTAIACAMLIPAVSAQFDDVYYDPDNVDLGQYNDDSYATNYESESINYYDDDEYEYYDDYDYHYTSRIKRFYRPYSGFGFYDPCYVSYNYYDPFDYDAYYYPGASIYISFGNSDYWSYRNWRRWNNYNRWNSFHSWNNWCLTPATYYYSYNSWCAPTYNYWGGYHGYNSYSNYYNSYYNSCPMPVSNYYGVTHGTVTTINTGGSRGTYYGPRITGNTGSSPRGPVVKPETVQPVMKGTDKGLTESNETPEVLGDGTRPGTVTRSNPVSVQPDGKTSTATPTSKDALAPGVVRENPVDRELKRDETAPVSRRPVFRPYPSDDSKSERPADGRPGYTPTTPSRENGSPSSQDVKPGYEPTPRSNDKPSYSPPARNENDRPAYRPAPQDDRPRYSPPSRNNEERPSYSPPAQRDNDSGRSNERPSYSPPQRDTDSGRSNDRPSYSPPPRSESSSARSSSAPASARDSGSSSGGSRSSSTPRTSPRG